MAKFAKRRRGISSRRTRKGIKRGGFKKFRSQSMGHRPTKRFIKKQMRKTVRRVVRQHRAHKQLIHSAKTVGDQAYMETFVDQAKYTNTTNALAQAFWWGTNCVSTPVLSSGTVENLCLDQGAHLQNMFRNLTRANPNGNNLGSNLKLIRKTAQVSCKLVNAETSPVELTEYRIMARHDQSVTPGALLYLQGQYNAGTGVAVVDGTGIDFAGASQYPGVQATANGGYPVAVGTTPFMLHAFVQQYKVMKVKKHFIMPGRWKKITYTQRKPRTFALQQILNTNIGTNTTTGGTPWIVRKGQTLSMFVAKGTWATDSGANATYKIGLSNINIGLEYQYRYHYGFYASNYSTSSSNQSIPGFNGSGSFVPLPIVANQPISAIAVGTPAAVPNPGDRAYGTGTYNPSLTAGITMLDADQMDV